MSSQLEPHHHFRTFLTSLLFILLTISGCHPGSVSETATPAATATSTFTITATTTSTPTVTVTPLPTVTPHPSRTSTATRTAKPSPTSTQTETPAPFHPAQLWPKRDINDKPIDWGYSHITDIGWNSKGEVVRFSAVLGFQLTDRAIHRKTVTVIGKTLTVYYLNVRHQTGRELLDAKLIVGGVFGEDVPVGGIPAGGPSYVKLRIMNRYEVFDHYLVHITAILPYEKRNAEYPDTLMPDLEQVLAHLPDQIILLADQAIIVDPVSVQRFEYDLRTVPYLVARYYPWLLLDDYDRFAGPNQSALELADNLYLSKPITNPIEWYSGETLIIITGSK